MKDGWKIVKLGEIGTFVRGGGFLKRDYVDNGYPCIHYGQIHMKLGVVTTQHITMIPESLAVKSKIASKGDVIIAITSEDVEGSCKSTAWMGNYDIAVGAHTAIFNHCQNPVFISYFLKSPQFNKYKAKYTRGFKVVEIKPSDIAKIEMPLPPLEEQHRIVSILDASFEKIDALKKNAEENLKNAKALFQQVLAQELKPKEGWVEKKLGEVLKLQSGENLPSKKMKVGKYPVYGGNGISGYHDVYNMNGHNVIIGRVGALCGNARYLTERFWLTDNGFKVILNPEYDIDLKYLTGYLNFLNLRQYAKQAAQPVISNVALKGVKFNIPSIAEQHRIVRTLDTLSDKCRRLEQVAQQTIRECDALKQSILRKAFNGEL